MGEDKHTVKETLKSKVFCVGNRGTPQLCVVGKKRKARINQPMEGPDMFSRIQKPGEVNYRDIVSKTSDNVDGVKGDECGTRV